MSEAVYDRVGLNVNVMSGRTYAKHLESVVTAAISLLCWDLSAPTHTV